MFRSGVKSGSDQFLIPQRHELFPSEGVSAPALTQPVTAKQVIGYDFSTLNSTVTITGVGISDVSDSSGNANSATQATDARRLLHGSATINGRLVASSGADVAKHLTMPASITGWANNGQPPVHILCLFQVLTWTTNRQLMSFQNGGGSPRLALRLSTTGGNRIEARTPTAVPGSTATLSTETTLTINTTYLAELSIDSGGNAALIINEGTPATTTSASSAEALTIRRVYDLAAAPDALMGAIYIFSDALTGPELASWRAFLKQRWAY